MEILSIFDLMFEAGFWFIVARCEMQGARHETDY